MRLLSSFDVKKASGPGCIDTKSLKFAAPAIAAPLTHIYNLSLGTECVPSIWKKANVTPVFKKGDKKDPNNHRPISIIPAVGKVLEKIAYSN